VKHSAATGRIPVSKSHPSLLAQVPQDAAGPSSINSADPSVAGHVRLDLSIFRPSRRTEDEGPGHSFPAEGNPDRAPPDDPRSRIACIFESAVFPEWGFRGDGWRGPILGRPRGARHRKPRQGCRMNQLRLVRGLVVGWCPQRAEAAPINWPQCTAAISHNNPENRGTAKPGRRGLVCVRGGKKVQIFDASKQADPGPSVPSQRGKVGRGSSRKYGLRDTSSRLPDHVAHGGSVDRGASTAPRAQDNEETGRPSELAAPAPARFGPAPHSSCSVRPRS